MKALSLALVFWLAAFAAEGASVLVYRPARVWGAQESMPLRRMNLSEAQIQSLQRQGFLVEEEQAVFLLQTFPRQRFFVAEMDGGGGGTSTEPPVWAMAAMRVPEAHQLPRGKGEGVNICVLDSGLNPHPALSPQPGQPNVVREARNFTDSRQPQDLSDRSGHGTAIATLIAGRSVGSEAIGVAPASSLSIAKVIPAEGTGSIGALAEGFRWCLDRAQVINMSVGFYKESAIMKDLMAEAYRRQITVVAAAGNDPRGVLPSAREKTVLAVGAVNAQGQISKFSGRGLGLDFLAPGEGIPLRGVDGSVSVKSGTSLSAAFMSGVEAIRRSRGAPALKARPSNSPLENGVGVIDAFATATSPRGN